MDMVISWLSGNWFILTILAGAGGLLIRVDRRVQKLFTTVDKMERKRIEGGKRNELLIQGMDATLDALSSEGHNGKVTKAKEALDSYMREQAAR